ncbi:MAG: phosphoribosylglycinamide formyltransferase [Omnitrophica bacterium RIFCSPHIGHO2_02_FULL_49_9]|nr:MAG: phosphoribosylglycinamide formyltransferase [Omnitrophica bacterium RIFCSPHIGHO2_02_FULL_49_9]OGW89982.1 MAG: phosphoribosylglycinamide formyltransferase [Omnitrophica bacterium RIFCSPLOWO2_01_FULL_50_24]
MSEREKRRAAIFVSGSGTNMENIARRIRAGELAMEIALVVCDRPNAFALKRAKRLRLETFVAVPKTFSSKEEYERKIDEVLRAKHIHLILLAGYMRILGSEFVRAWPWQILNIHPSLLPQFPGTHAIRDAFEAKEKQTGVTVHFVDEGVDTGPILLQRAVPIRSTDTLERLEERVHAAEYQVYPEAIRLVLSGKVKVTDRRVEML